MGGYIGKILKVDLTKGKIETVKLEDSFYRKWLGGYGIGVRILYNEMVPNVNPLGPDNILGFSTGVLTGTLAHFSGRFTVVGKSPLTGTWGDSSCGGFFGPELKFAGFDAVFFYGKSEKPVYLWIRNGEAELYDATAVWGKTVYETEDWLKRKHGDKRVQVASIGPAGEMLSLISCIIHDKGRAAGRSGLGAVMGSKKLKAIAVRGTGKIPIAHSEKLLELRKKHLDTIKKDPFYMPFRKYGMSATTAASAFSGDTPVKNWGGIGQLDFPTAAKLSGDNVVEYDVGPYACYGCPVGCGGLSKVKNGSYACEGHKPEYETLASFGALCLNDNVESIIYLNHLCNNYGLDTISVGATVAFAIECYENGLINKEDTEGVELTWGNTEAIVEITKKIAKREGFGEVLADGVKLASERIGKGSDKYAMHVGGQELPMHDPRLGTVGYNKRLGLVYVADATPARHTQRCTPIGYALQATGLCLVSEWMGEGKKFLVDVVNAVSGWNITADELLVVGKRIATMRQAFNVREGFKPSDFKLPDRVLGKPPLKHGPLAGVTIHPEDQVKEYFESMGWELKTGRPSKKTLTELGLQDVIKDLYMRV